MDLVFHKCEGEGQGSCQRCLDKGKWNRAWMRFLYRVDDLPGCYCWECLQEIIKEREAKNEN